MEPWLFSLIQCPITGEPLHDAPSEIVEGLANKIASGQLFNRLGLQVTDAFDAGLVNRSLRWFYPITNGYPSLLPDEAIELLP